VGGRRELGGHRWRRREGELDDDARRRTWPEAAGDGGGEEVRAAANRGWLGVEWIRPWLVEIRRG
jgi:hypothetical protein